MTMIDENTITVGIPTFNRPDNLKEIIQCVQNQTYKNIRILISDNDSDRKHNIENIVDSFSKDDKRITYYKQKKNIGALRNMLFLLKQAKTKYFIWMADDDMFESIFLEELHKALSSFEEASVALSGIDIVDIMNQQAIKFDITKYLQQLSSPAIYQRLLNHITQPAEWGKARVYLGLCKTEYLKSATKDIIEQGQFTENSEILSMAFPLDMQLLVYGDLVVVPKTLFHVFLLPSSNGLQEGEMFTGKEVQQCKMTYEAYRKVVRNAPITQDEKKELIQLINKAERNDLIRIIPFNFLKRYCPRVARNLKKIYFALFVR